MYDTLLPLTSSPVRHHQAIQIRSNQRYFDQLSAEEEDESEELATIFVALAAMGGPLRQLRTYLTRADLPGDPLAESAWAYLWSSQSDRAFITTMGVDVNTFQTILNRFTIKWGSETIPRGDVNSNGEPQPRWRSLDAAGCLGLILHYLNSTMPAYSLQQIFGITPAVCSRYLAVGLQHLLSVLKTMRQARIVWPSTEEAIKPYSNAIDQKFPLLRQCFGFINGLNLPVLVSDDDE